MLVPIEVLMATLKHITNINVLLVSVIRIQLLHLFLLLVFDSIFVSVMVLLCSVQPHSVRTNRNVSPFVGGCFNDRTIVYIAILVVLN